MPTAIRKATPSWTTESWTELPGDFTQPIYFKILETKSIGKVSIQLMRGERTKKLTLHSLDPSTAMGTLINKAKEWEIKLSDG